MHYYAFYQGSHPAMYKISKPAMKKGQYNLNCNHSHFILVDDGTQHRSASNLAFRAALEAEIARLKTDDIGEGKCSSWLS